MCRSIEASGDSVRFAVKGSKINLLLNIGKEIDGFIVSMIRHESVATLPGRTPSPWPPPWYERARFGSIWGWPGLPRAFRERHWSIDTTLIRRCYQHIPFYPLYYLLETRCCCSDWKER